ncbi:hypothetical protein C8F01DRAFT_369485 [Mycena amicta]|nr:hypothetical protein C8F01DRAFT_369485 [Mycena amicta]
MGKPRRSCQTTLAERTCPLEDSPIFPAQNERKATEPSGLWIQFAIATSDALSAKCEDLPPSLPATRSTTPRRSSSSSQRLPPSLLFELPRIDMSQHGGDTPAFQLPPHSPNRHFPLILTPFGSCPPPQYSTNPNDDCVRLPQAGTEATSRPPLVSTSLRSCWCRCRENGRTWNDSRCRSQSKEDVPFETILDNLEGGCNGNELLGIVEGRRKQRVQSFRRRRLVVSLGRLSVRGSLPTEELSGRSAKFEEESGKNKEEPASSLKAACLTSPEGSFLPRIRGRREHPPFFYPRLSKPP